MATGKALSNKQSGFSLVELLVVMAIMAMMVSVVSLSIGGVADSDELDDAAVSIRALLETASTQAIVRHQPLAMHWIAPAQTGTEQWQFRWSGWRDGYWRDEIEYLPGIELPPGITPSITVDGEPWSGQDTETPVLVFYPTGESMAFALRLSGDRQLTITSEPDGSIAIKGNHS